MNVQERSKSPQCRELHATLWERTAQGLQKVVFPPKCYSCNVFYHPCAETTKKPFTLTEHFAQGMTQFLCPVCAKAFVPIASPLCTQCGAPFKSKETDDHLCGVCLATPKHFSAARAAGVYESALTAVIHQFKYHAKSELSKPLGDLLWVTLQRYWEVRDIDLIIPIPLHRTRLRKRGFNQAHLIVKEWGRVAPEIVRPRISKKDILERSRHTEPQTALNSQQRLLSIKNAFRVGDGLKVTDKRVLLVDDVYTTGATVNECAKVLIQAGAGRVDVLTLARAV